MDALKELTGRRRRYGNMHYDMTVFGPEDSQRFGQPQFESELQTPLSQIGVE
jgi:hypothetical protein